MTWLITGGAGFIGAHVVRALQAAGEGVVVLDDVSAGFPERLPADVPLVRGSVTDRAAVDRVIADHGITGVIHTAAKKQVGESVEQPLMYYRENMLGLTTLLEAVAAAGVRRFVFSSSAAVYGSVDVELVTEETPCHPLSPYGETKLAGEWLVRAAGNAHGIATACLRYFNIAGCATPQLADTGVFNVIPIYFDRLTRGEAPLIYGDDYDTPDGTCIRDYIHVVDLADAHLAAARYVSRPDAVDAGDITVNLGSGTGVSVREMADVIADVTGRHEPAARVVERRPGDPAKVVASYERAEKELGWTPRRDVRDMVTSAWEGWCLHHPEARVR
ncbi:UDP-glucose 4-epimerase GalE [Streptomyces boninensis]|uniref:UDP-glucose 4-epimerase GalE n=1 Tax=Streptomyces boninensis TaxID=2039455 RepID=UPI003B20ED89